MLWNLERRALNPLNELGLLTILQICSPHCIYSHVSQLILTQPAIVLRIQIIFGERAITDERIIAVDRQHQALIEVAAHRMLRQFGAAARPQIAGNADFNRNLALGQFFDQFRIPRCGEPVPDAFGFTDEHLRELARNSFEASFLPAEKKVEFLNLFDSAALRT